MTGRDGNPDLQCALEMVRRAVVALKRGDLDTTHVLLAEAEQSLASVAAQAGPPEGWYGAATLGSPGAIDMLEAFQCADEAGPSTVEPGARSTDPLTGLLDYRAFPAHAAQLAASVPATETCWLVMVDVDRFAVVNERRGHLAGDAYLKALGCVFRGHVRAPHCAARVGGDEFLAVLRDLTLTQARAVAEDLRAAVEKLERPDRATVSIGVAGWLPASELLEEAFRRADVALYAAKARGGNRVHVSNIDDDGPDGRLAGVRA